MSLINTKIYEGLIMFLVLLFNTTEDQDLQMTSRGIIIMLTWLGLSEDQLMTE